MKQYKVTGNGFVFLYLNGIRTSTHFYHPGTNQLRELEAFGYSKIPN